ncbi:hypothetical protein GCM10010915_24640 [Microbacterium faecale]|uniref:Uncharacterized protein n=1 Tax=Microbacterium faecale TaxID=1804630 RepID=A0A916YF28_9MICO|nr:hypothetical protein GCM10010915_24640 [Microbacterium faecale]
MRIYRPEPPHAKAPSSARSPRRRTLPLLPRRLLAEVSTTHLTARARDLHMVRVVRKALGPEEKPAYRRAQ